MKKILFCLQTMTCGGVEKELITFLKKFNKNEYDITVLLMYIQDQQMISEIPEYVHIINLDMKPDFYFSNTVTMVKKRIKKFMVFEALCLVANRIFKCSTDNFHVFRNKIPKNSTFFDIAVCFHAHSSFTLKYVSEIVHANKKILWIHSDLYKTKFPLQKMKRFIGKYNEVVSVSKKVKDEFDVLIPDYKGNSSFAHNIVDDDEIISKSNEIIDIEFLDNTECKILTVGRFCPEKGIDKAIECCKMLRDDNIKFHWYFIGWGDEESLYQQMISEYSLQKFVTILGRKDNPYPYLKNCDIYCQPSRHEAWCLALTEAKVLCKPIVCTDFSGADEQIENEKTGIIVSVNNTDLLFDKVKELILHEEYRETLSANLMFYKCHENNWERIEKHFK